MKTIRELTADETGDPKLLPLGEEIRAYYRNSGTMIEIDLQATLNSVRMMILAGIGVFIVLEDDGSPIGFICGVASGDPLSGRIVATEIFWYTAKDRRHEGLGELLIRAFEMWAKAKGAQRIRLAHLVDLRAGENQRLYEAMGFKACEVAYEREV